MPQNNQVSINIEDLSKILEPLIRRVIREELDRVVKSDPAFFLLNSDMPLYDDMQNLMQRKANGKIELHSHKEVWGE